MATATKKKTAKKKTAKTSRRVPLELTNGATVTKKTKELKMVRRAYVTFRIIGVSPLVQNRFTEKALAQIRAKQQQGKKTRDRDLKDPKELGEAAMYRTPDNKPGLPAVALKAALIEAAHNDLGFPKTLVKKALFIHPVRKNLIIPLEMPDNPKKSPPYEIGEDAVRVNSGTDLRYRPYFEQWAVTTRWEIDEDLLQTDDLMILADRAGFGVGLCEHRPEKGGEWGRFRVDPNFATITEG